MSKLHEGYLFISDITGYTRYLSESELEHAQETLAALLELLVENTGPPLVISRLAGDAVISYGLRGDFFQGQTFIEKIEDTYITFKKPLSDLYSIIPAAATPAPTSQP
jgi:sulfate adenylyltransferase subunit 1 (EFTu-like GTPase family)